MFLMLQKIFDLHSDGKQFEWVIVNAEHRLHSGGTLEKIITKLYKGYSR